MTKWFRLTVIVVGLAGLSRTSLSQEMRIFTTIRDISASGGQKTSDQRSLMLFHAGKVYDYIEPAQEVTVFEPAHQKFTVLNVKRQLRTELHQDEIRQFLGMAEDEANKRLANREDETNPATRKALDLLQCLVQPDFSATFDPMKSQLTVGNTIFRYEVSVDTQSSPEIVEKYLHVADWTAQFNSVLHPQSFLPAPRMKLNQELRKRGMLPKLVGLRVETAPALHMEARHEWTWNLQKTDRQMIDDWEKQLQSSKIKSISFREFQREMLKTETAKKR